MRAKRHDSFWVMEKSPHHLFQSLLSWEICRRFSLLSSWTYFSWYLKYLTDWLFSCASQLVIVWNEIQSKNQTLQSFHSSVADGNNTSSQQGSRNRMRGSGRNQQLWSVARPWRVDVKEGWDAAASLSSMSSRTIVTLVHMFYPLGID